MVPEVAGSNPVSHPFSIIVRDYQIEEARLLTTAGLLLILTESVTALPSKIAYYLRFLPLTGSGEPSLTVRPVLAAL